MACCTISIPYYLPYLAALVLPLLGADWIATGMEPWWLTTGTPWVAWKSWAFCHVKSRKMMLAGLPQRLQPQKVLEFAALVGMSVGPGLSMRS
jgi:hypothetical protein